MGGTCELVMVVEHAARAALVLDHLRPALVVLERSGWDLDLPDHLASE